MDHSSLSSRQRHGVRVPRVPPSILKEAGLSDEGIARVVTLVGAMLGVFSAVKEAELLPRSEFNEAIEHAQLSFRNDLSNLWIYDMDFVQISVTRIVDEVFRDLSCYDARGIGWDAQLPHQMLRDSISAGSEREDLVATFGMLAAYPHETTMLDQMLGVGEGITEWRLGDTLKIGDALMRLYQADPHLQVAGPGIEAAMERWANTPYTVSADFDRMIEQILETIGRVPGTSINS